MQQNGSLPTDVSGRQQKRSRLACLAFQFGAFILEGSSRPVGDGGSLEISGKPSIQAENKVEANKLANNYRVRH